MVTHEIDYAVVFQLSITDINGDAIKEPRCNGNIKLLANDTYIVDIVLFDLKSSTDHGKMNDDFGRKPYRKSFATIPLQVTKDLPSPEMRAWQT
jgi:hypothetical protein